MKSSILQNDKMATSAVKILMDFFFSLCQKFIGFMGHFTKNL